jgi:hypothetical protein
MITVILFGISPLAAWILNIIYRRRLPRIVAGLILFVCLLIASPLLFTKYYYSDLFDGFYSAFLIKAIILCSLLFIVLNMLRNKTVRGVVLISALIITLGDMSLTVFARGFVGDDRIYSTKRINGYRMIYRREADAVLTGATRIDLYKVALFGLLQKNIDFVYPGKADGSCRIVLNDSLDSKHFEFNFCENKIYP